MMLKFKKIHIYCNHANNLDFKAIVAELQKYFPKISIDIRYPFLDDVDNALAESLISIRISDLRKPFDEQPRIKDQEKLDQNIIDYERNFSRHTRFNDTNNNNNINRQHKELILYDGFMMQRLLGTMINEDESNTDHVHIVFEDRLISTFSEDDLRYHARTFVAGSPSIISTTGIVEAPAKPKEWYIKQMQQSLYIYDMDNDDNQIDKTSAAATALSSSNVKKYLDYGDYRINFAAVGYALQVLFFFITNGDPFCNNIHCRLYNAHWQEELLQSQIQNQRLCDDHDVLLHQFNTVYSH